MSSLSRKKFIESQGATCANWTWSWSFVNMKEKFVIFGAWDIHTRGNTSLILGEEWGINSRGRKPPAYDQAIEHIRLVEEEGYQLKTFAMKMSNANKDEEGIGPSKIESFEPKIINKFLKRIGNDWYASDNFLGNSLPEEIVTPKQFIEGASKQISVNTYERDDKARAECIKHHGYKCKVCGFEFKKFYGPLGENYIHVHHKIPLADIRKEYILDPVNDLVPVCPNCHAMIHKTQPALSIEQLKLYLKGKS